MLNNGRERVDVASISKFVGKNYPQCHFQLVCTLKAKGLFDITCGIEKRPVATETNAATRAKWSKDDAIAMFTLTAGMKISQITLVESCESSKVKMNSNESITQHVAKVERTMLHHRRD